MLSRTDILAEATPALMPDTVMVEVTPFPVAQPLSGMAALGVAELTAPAPVTTILPDESICIMRVPGPL